MSSRSLEDCRFACPHGHRHYEGSAFCTVCGAGPVLESWPHPGPWSDPLQVLPHQAARERERMSGSLEGRTISMVHHPACNDHSRARNVCKCGANVACSACGWGRGAIPCKCQPAAPLANVARKLLYGKGRLRG